MLLSRYILWLSLCAASLAAHAAEINVAVATNFLATARILTQRFEMDSGHRVHLISGSTGKLVTQIKQGAPFDVLLAADAEHPRLLEAQGLAVQGSRFTYAVGRLVLWGAQPGALEPQTLLNSGNFRHLAIANPDIAPYGKAARQVLRKLNLWNAMQARLVQGEDVGQTFQFVASGNAELGFVALAQVISLSEPQRNNYWIVPQELYEPIDQQAVLLTRAADKPAARALFSYLESNEARALVRQRGYMAASELDYSE
ncbi:MAG: molybdate ABC transporter substrate-binding protein [Pseudomonadota bacterium]